MTAAATNGPAAPSCLGGTQTDQKGAAKYVKLGVGCLKRGGPKKNIVDVDFGDRIQIPGIDEAALRVRVEKYLGRDRLISNSWICSCYTSRPMESPRRSLWRLVDDRSSLVLSFRDRAV